MHLKFPNFVDSKASDQKSASTGNFLDIGVEPNLAGNFAEPYRLASFIVQQSKAG